ncbi:MAG: ankyrin repeat domain-containing protein [Akkermansia sp.]|nr:ankyrin repeat domain-containing protein [Akkermansia sp.]
MLRSLTTVIFTLFALSAVAATDPYAPPLYNNEEVPLPAWVKKELRDINALLREKLSPSDYLEILKGEHFLFAKYASKAQYKRNESQISEYESIKRLDKCREFLYQILSTPDNVKLFKRAYLPKDKIEGIFFRDDLRYCRDEIIYEHPTAVLTKGSGEMDSLSTMLTAWDSRTGRRVGRFSLPVCINSRVYTREAGEDELAYALFSFTTEGPRHYWNMQDIAHYIWVPSRGVFQTLLAPPDYMDGYIEPYSHNNPGDLYRELQLVQTPLKPLADKDDIQSGWRSTSYGAVDLLGQVYSAVGDDYRAERDFYVDADARGTEVVFTRTHNRLGYTAPEKNLSYIIDFDTLSTKRQPVSTYEQNRQRTEEVMNRMRRIMVPNPVTDGGDRADLLEHADYNERHLELGDATGGYVPFCFSEGHEDEGSSMAGGIIGLITPQEKAYLYKWDDLLKRRGGRLLPYEQCVTREATEYEGNMSSEVQEEFTPYVRTHFVRETDGGDSAEIVMVIETNDMHPTTLVLKLNVHDYSYTVEHVLESENSILCPVWLPEKNWFLKPVSNECYHIMQIGSDKSAEKLAELYVDPDRGFAIVLPDGRYAGSPGCESFLGYGEGKLSVGLGAMAPWLNRPAEVLAALGGNSDDVEALRATTARWLQSMGYDVKKMPGTPLVEHFPVVDVKLPQLLEKKESVEFDVTLRAARKAITSLDVRAAGSVVEQAGMDELLVPAGRQETFKLKVPLAVGQNWIEICPVDSTGTRGDTVRFRVVRELVTQDSNIYVVALGVSDYSDDSLDLQYAAKDAGDIAAAFARETGNKTRTLVLTDKDVTRDVLSRVREFLADSQLNDRVIFYVAGHGVLDDKLEYRFAPSGFDSERISETGISMQELAGVLQQAPARYCLLLLDTCHSGQIGEADVDKLALAGVSLPPGVRAIQKRGMKVKNTADILDSSRKKKRYIEDFFAMGALYRGVNIIAAAAGAEYALESGEWQNGVFASAIMQAISDKERTDRNADATLSVEELQRRVQVLVQHLTGGAQKPSVVMSEDGAMSIITPSVSWLSSAKKRITGWNTDSEQINNDWQKIREWCKSTCSAEEATELMQELARHDMPSDIYERLLELGADTTIAAVQASQVDNEVSRRNLDLAFKYGATAEAATKCLTVRMKYEKLMYLKQHGADIRSVGAEMLREKSSNWQSENEVEDNLRCIRLLLGDGVDVNACDVTGNTALHHAAAYMDNYRIRYMPRIIDELLRNGADIGIRNKAGKRPGDTDHGSRAYLEQRVRLLSGNTGKRQISHGNTGDRSSLDPLIARMAALKCKHADSALYQRRLLTLLPLIRNGADVDITLPETKGNTALHYSCAIGSLSITKWLLEHGANPNAVTNKGATPLMCVGSDNRNAIIQALRAYGAVR